MSRSFPNLTTKHPNEIDDPSERSAVLAAHRQAALAASSSDVPPVHDVPPGGGSPAARLRLGQLFVAIVDRSWRLQRRPRLLPVRRSR